MSGCSGFDIDKLTDCQKEFYYYFHSVDDCKKIDLYDSIRTKEFSDTIFVKRYKIYNSYEPQCKLDSGYYNLKNYMALYLEEKTQMGVYHTLSPFPAYNEWSITTWWGPGCYDYAQIAITCNNWRKVCGCDTVNYEKFYDIFPHLLQYYQTKWFRIRR